MTTRRVCHALAVLDGELHAVGGAGETSVEKYDPRADSWSAVPGMALPEELERYHGMSVLRRC